MKFFTITFCVLCGLLLFSGAAFPQVPNGSNAAGIIPYASSSLTDSLKAYWAMDDSTRPTVMADSSTNANNGSFVGTPSWGAGIRNQAMILSGSQNGTVPNNASLNITNAITLAAWIKPTQRGTQRIVQKKWGATGYELFLGANSPYPVSVRLNGDANSREDSHVPYPINGTWMHVAATWDGSFIRLYINGALDSVKTWTGPIVSNSGALGVGADSANGSRFFGSLDEVRIYRRALSAAEILTLATIPPMHTITASAGPNGTIFPSGAVSVPDGSSQLFTMTPNNGYHVADVLVDGSSVGPLLSYTFTNVISDHTISVSFAQDPPRLAGHWAMDEGSGTTLTDSSGLGNTGTTVGNPLWVNGERGMALSFNGTTQYATVPDAASLRIPNAITMAAWIKPGQTATAYVIKKSTQGSVNGFELSLSSTGKYFVRFNQATSQDTFRLNSRTATNYPSDGNTWAHFAATYDGTTMKIYINGVLDTSLAKTVTIAANNMNLGIGAQADGTSKLLGTIDDARVYNYALSASEILALSQHTIIASAGSNGGISPSGNVLVNHGANQTFTITPNTGYHVADVLVDGVSVGPQTSYTFTNVIANHTITASFAINTYTITASAGPNGAISPSGSIVINYGHDTTFTMTPNTGYHVTDVLVDGVSVGAVPSYTFTNVIANHTIAASFAINTYTITASAGPNGTISPSGSIVINYGHDTTFTMTPNTGYHLADVLVDGVSVGAVPSYTFTNVIANHTITVSFAINTYTITASAGPNGAISPSGSIVINYGYDTTFTMTPNTGYHVADVLVDGVSVGAVPSYTFTNVIANHTIAASFAINIYTITASAGPNGAISPSGSIVIDYGRDTTFTMTPNTGYHVADVLVDGVSVGAIPSYTFTNVIANHTITVSFAIDTYTITASAGPNGTISPSGSIVINYGYDTTFAMIPNTGYHVADVLVDGVSVGAVPSYTFTNVIANHTITVNFAVTAFTITATAGSNGSIFPNDVVFVDYGADTTFTMTPNTGYHVADVLVDGVSVGAVPSYTFTNVIANHTIAASFAINTYAITASAGPGGAISPSGSIVIDYGRDTTFTITPNIGYHVADVLVDGVSVGAVPSYTFTNVIADHSITANFMQDRPPVLSPIGSQTIAEGGHLAVRISATDPDGDPITVLAEQLPSNASFTDSTGGVGGLAFNPDYSQAGLYTVRIIANSNLLSDTELVDITVTNVDQPPSLNPIGPQSISEGSHLAIRVSAFDADGDIITLSAEQLPVNATFADSSNGIGGFTFDPDFTQSGLYHIRFIARSNSLADTELVDITVTELDRPPILAPIGPRSVNEGDSLVFNISATDPDGAIPTFFAEGLPFNSSFVDNGNGTGRFRFHPDFNQAGVYDVTFIASDGQLADSEIVQITVINTDRPPVLGSIGPQTVAEDGLLQFVVTSFDLDGNNPTLSANPLPPNASFHDSLNGDGLFRFQPDYGQNGVYNILFIASDGLLADSELVQITVTTTDRPPVFDPVGNQFVLEGGSLSFDVHAVDPDGPIPTLSASNLLRNSTFTDNHNGTGSFHYNPDFTQSGIDIVSFIASDGELSDTIDVQITTIDAGNQRPVLAPIGSKMVNEGQQLQFNIHGSDPDSTIPTLVAQHLPLNAVFHDSTNGVGTFTFNPNYDQAGADTVLFYVTDGQLADSEYVFITVNNVNRAPVLSPIGPQSVLEGDSLGINISASDADGNFMIITAGPLLNHMTITDHGNGTAFFSFLPDFSQSGVYYVRFIVSDSTLADSETVQIAVMEAGNQPPVLAPIDSAYYVTEGMTLTIPISATDPEGSPLSLTASPLVQNMTFTDNHNGTGQFVFHPSYVQGGIYGVTFRAFDGQDYDSAFTRIYVAESGNQYPVLDSIGPRTVAEGEILTINVSASDPEGFMPFLYINNPPDSSTFVDHRNGTGTFTYYPNYFAAGVHNVRFIAMDNGGLTDYEDVAITVTDVNRPPHIVYAGDTLVYEGGTLVATVTAYDSTDYIPGQLALTVGYIPPHSTFMLTGNGVGRFTFAPDYDQAGIDSAFFLVVDSDSPPLSDQKWIRIRIINVNRPPVMPQPPPQEINQGDTLNMTITATDPDGDPLTMFINNYPPNPALPPNATFLDQGGGIGIFRFIPDYTQNGIFIINFAATDGHQIVTRPTLIQVDDMGNQRPTLSPIGPLSVREGDSLFVIITSTDPDSTRPTLTLQSPLYNMSFTNLGNGTGIMQYHALYNQSGNYNLLFIASDGQLADSELVPLTVIEAGNQRPNLAHIVDRSVAEGATLTFSVSATDPDSTIPHLGAHVLPANASFVDSLNGRGTFTFAPNFFQSGIYPITFTATDAQDSALVDSQLVQITVTDVNRRPTFDPLPADTVYEGDTLAFTVTAHDPDSTIPLLNVGHIPPNATFNDNGNGTGLFFFTPSFFQAGVDSAKFYAIDQIDHGLFSTMTVRITILNVNRPPVLRPIPDTTIGDGFMLSLNILATDPDTVPPILFQRGKPDSASFVDHGNGTGEFRWRPRFADVGVYQFFIGCRDRSFPQVSDSQFVTIQVVSSGNHPPVFDPIPNQQLGFGDTLSLHIVSADIDNDPITLSHVGGLPFGLVFSDSGNGHASIFWIPTIDQGGDTLVTLVAQDPFGLTDTLRIQIRVVTFIRGDANGDGHVNGVDVVFFVLYLKGGQAPDPLEAADANGDGHVNGIDIVYLINYFKGIGPPPPPVPPAPPNEGGKIYLKARAGRKSIGL